MVKQYNYRILWVLGFVLMFAGLEVFNNFRSVSAKKAEKKSENVQASLPSAPPQVRKNAPTQGLVSSSSLPLKATASDPELAAAIKKAANRSTEGLVEEPIPGGGYGIDLQGRFQNVTIVKAGPEGQTSNACVTSLGEANAFFERNLETGEALPATTQGPPVAAKPRHPEMTRQELDRKSTRLNSSHGGISRMPSSA